jgi:hypothetical protein
VAGTELSVRGGIHRSWICKGMLAASGILGRSER